MRHKTIIFLIFALIPGVLFGQLKKDTKPIDIPTRIAYGNGGGSLLANFGLDPSKLHISHSYQMSYFSGAGRDGSLGMYLNTMSYEFSKSFDMAVQWGVAHQPFGGNLGRANKFMNSPFVSGAQLRYKPSDKFQIQLNYNSLPYWSVDYYKRPYSNFNWME